MTALMTLMRSSFTLALCSYCTCAAGACFALATLPGLAPRWGEEGVGSLHGRTRMQMWQSRRHVLCWQPRASAAAPAMLHGRGLAGAARPRAAAAARRAHRKADGRGVGAAGEVRREQPGGRALQAVQVGVADELHGREAQAEPE